MELKKAKVIKAQVYSRVVGFYRPVEDWNKGKQSEFADRHVQSVSDMSYATERKFDE